MPYTGETETVSLHKITQHFSIISFELLQVEGFWAEFAERKTLATSLYNTINIPKYVHL